MIAAKSRAEYQREWRAANPGKTAEYKRKYYLGSGKREKAAEYSREYARKNREKRNAWHRKWRDVGVNKERELERNRQYHANPDNRSRIAGHKRKWREANAGKGVECVRRRQAKKLNASPSWLTEGQLQRMQSVYEAAKMLTERGLEVYHVDHIVPLQGRKVCGLHVPWNLQILTAEDNASKNNKLPPADQLVDYSAKGYAGVRAKLKGKANNERL